MHVMRSKPRRRRGISTVIAGTIIILLIIVGVVPLLMLYLSTSQTVLNTYNVKSTYEELKELEDIEANVSDNTLTIANKGAVPVDISFITLSNSEDVCSIILGLYDYITRTVPDPVIDESNVMLNSLQKVVRIEQGGYIKLNITGLIQQGAEDVCSIVTARGNVIKVPKIEVAQKAQAIIITPVTIDATALTERTDITVNENEIQPATPDSPGIGMSRISPDGTSITALLRYFVAESADGSESLKIIGLNNDGSCNISFNNIYIGYSPEWSRNRRVPARYNIMITGYEPLNIKVSKDGANIIIYGDNTYIENITDYYKIVLPQMPYRIKIIDYIPSSGNLVLYYDRDYNGSLDRLVNEDALGYWWLYSDQYVSKYEEIQKGYIELNGNASQIIVYLTAYDMGLNINESSYDPYFFSADVDGNGYPEFVFITEDEGCSITETTSNPEAELANDVGHGSNKLIDYTWSDDWSTKKFLVNLTGYTVNGADMAFVQVAIKLYFHDNLYDNPAHRGNLYSLTEEIYYNNRPVIGLYVVDAETGKIVSSREWQYQELDNYENTFPPSKSSVVLTATLPIPQSGIYYLAIGFLDPYSNSAIDYYLTNWECSGEGKDDGDFIIAIEVIGLTYYARP